MPNSRESLEHTVANAHAHAVALNAAQLASLNELGAALVDLKAMTGPRFGDNDGPDVEPPQEPDDETPNGGGADSEPPVEAGWIASPNVYLLGSNVSKHQTVFRAGEKVAGVGMERDLSNTKVDCQGKALWFDRTYNTSGTTENVEVRNTGDRALGREGTVFYENVYGSRTLRRVRLSNVGAHGFQFSWRGWRRRQDDGGENFPGNRETRLPGWDSEEPMPSSPGSILTLDDWKVEGTGQITRGHAVRSSWGGGCFYNPVDHFLVTLFKLDNREAGVFEDQHGRIWRSRGGLCSAPGKNPNQRVKTVTYDSLQLHIPDSDRSALRLWGDDEVFVSHSGIFAPVERASFQKGHLEAVNTKKVTVTGLDAPGLMFQAFTWDGVKKRLVFEREASGTWEWVYDGEPWPVF